MLIFRLNFLPRVLTQNTIAKRGKSLTFIAEKEMQVRVAFAKIETYGPP